KSYSYDFKLAHEKSSARRSSASKIPKKMSGDLKARVLNCVGQDWSPEQTSGRLKLEGICISQESIYECVRKDRAILGICVACHRKDYKYNKYGE
ncbi:MAG: hypothetical protein LBB12_04255, partial [Holosporaceae bacterium]|nr:hypothetical protein [Holosporaceae bacterium]